MAKNDLTAERLRYLIDYNPVSGVFLRIYRFYPDSIIFDPIKLNHGRGYASMQIDGKSYLAHRVAWMHANGFWPKDEIDHINGIKDDNRLDNLREASTAENCQNKIKVSSNTSGFTGVRRHQSAWRADIKLNKKYKFLGSYETAELAHAAYLRAKAELHTFQPIPRES